MSAVDLVLDRLQTFKLRPNGRDRWRACCPAHGGKNPSALSVGVGAEGQVLLKCWHGCTVDEVAVALGLDLEDLFPPKDSSAGRLQRRRLVTAGQALDLIDRELTLAVVCAADMAAGKALDAATCERLLLAAARVGELRQEARA